MTLYDHLGRPIDLGRLRAPVERGGWYSRTVGRGDRISSELTPALIASILTEADEGRPERFQALMDRIEDRDLHFFSVLQTRRLFVAERPLRVVPADTSRRARKAADLVREVLDGIPHLEDEFVSLLSSVTRGYSLSQIIWDPDEWVPERLLSWDARVFVPDPEDVHTLRVLTEAAPSEGEALAPAQWIQLRYRAKSGLPVRAGLGRIVAWYHAFKQFAIKDWLAFSELFGTPARIGKYAPGVSPEDRLVLERAVRGFGHDLAAVLPEGASIEFPETRSLTSSAELYERMTRFCNGEISKGLVGQTLTTEQGERGARSLGEVHERVLRTYAQGDARALASALRQHLVRPLVLFHLGEGHPLPELHFDLVDRAELLERASQLAEMGLPLSARWLYETFEIPAPEEGEATLSGALPLREAREGGVALAKKKASGSLTTYL